ncbi:hypothetical protein O181_044732 [Austropuccinia psidii MF-1]|uniref:Uncharacterized protein n=1 Tax=Austropuccinia psidii MF-1 TaxID=1389203 RepID=A0A9Q3HI22_9BASI|nr:hypothetical protein [Austropuccinia psidii MF-1]
MGPGHKGKFGDWTIVWSHGCPEAPENLCPRGLQLPHAPWTVEIKDNTKSPNYPKMGLDPKISKIATDVEWTQTTHISQNGPKGHFGGYIFKNHRDKTPLLNYQMANQG